MGYSDEALRTIRAALLEYRSATRENGRKRSWYAIAYDLYDEYLDLPEEDDDDALDPRTALAEALRRFSVGPTTPSPERLAAVCRYLMDRKFLSAADLQPSNPEPILFRALQEYFGLDGTRRVTGLPLAATFVGSRDVKNRTEISFLTIGPEEAGTFVVTEKLYSLPIRPQSTRRDALARILSRHGGSERRFTGWLVRSNGQHCLFARDDVTKEATVDLLMAMQVGGIGTPPIIITFVKSRDFGHPPAGYSGERMRVVRGGTPITAGHVARIQENIWHYRLETESDGS